MDMRVLVSVPSSKSSLVQKLEYHCFDTCITRGVLVLEIQYLRMTQTSRLALKCDGFR